MPYTSSEMSCNNQTHLKGWTNVLAHETFKNMNLLLLLWLSTSSVSPFKSSTSSKLNPPLWLWALPEDSTGRGECCGHNILDTGIVDHGSAAL